MPGNYFINKVKKILGAANDQEGNLHYLVSFWAVKEQFFKPQWVLASILRLSHMPLIVGFLEFQSYTVDEQTV